MMKYIRDDALDGSGSCTTFSMADKAYYVIKRRILEVALAPGVRVSELQIAQELGIGKTPVREALGRLVQEGLIKNLPYTGYDVTPVTLRDVQELFGLRLIVEPEAVALAAGRVDVDLLCEIEQACQRAYSHETPSQVSEFLQLNHRFHMTIAEASGNRRLALVKSSASIAALALWKQKGRDLLFSPTGPSGTPSPSGGGGHAGGLFGHVDNAVHRLLDIPGAYLSFDWHHMGQNLRALQEVFWSVRLLEFLLVAGVIALLVRGRRRGLFVVAWFLAIALVKGASSQASVFDTSLYRYLLPAWPAWVLIVASVVFFWPRGAEARKRSTVPRASPQAPSRPSNGLLVGSLLVLGLIPLTLTLAATRTPAGTIAQMVSGALVPIVDFRLTAKQTGPHSVALTWRGLKTGQTASVYRVFSGPNDGCHVTNEGTPRCLFHMPKMWWTERAVATASDAKPGRVTYRVALAADWRFDANSEADLVLLSKPVTITVR